MGSLPVPDEHVTIRASYVAHRNNGHTHETAIAYLALLFKQSKKIIREIVDKGHDEHA